MVADATKRQKKLLRKLAGQAYERELSAALEVVETAFKEWHNGALDVWEVDSRIHEYHQNTARELWKKYNYVDAQETVAFAVLREVINLDEIPDEVRDLVEHRVENIRSFQNWSPCSEGEANGLDEDESE